MTARIRQVEDAEEFVALWPKIWPLLDALEVFHAGLAGKELRDEREERALGKYQRRIGDGRYWFLIAEDGAEIVGTGATQVLDDGVTVPGPVGHTGDAFMIPSLRGHGLYRELSEMRLDLLRAAGMTIRESIIDARNERMVQLRSKYIWGTSWARPLRAEVPGPDAAIRRLKDPEDAWPAIWPLLNQPYRDEAAERARFDEAMERRGIILVVGDPPVAVLTGRLAVNPWLYKERVGAISDLVVADGEDPAFADALLARFEGWAASKRAESIQVRAVPQERSSEFQTRGFDPLLYQLQQRL